MTAKSDLEAQFAAYYRLLGADLPPLHPEFRFHPTRRWRFDFAVLEHKIGIEIEGGIYTNGRHTRGTGYSADCTKYNSATVLGWRILRYTVHHFDDPVQMIEDVRQLVNLISYKAG